MFRNGVNTLKSMGFGLFAATALGGTCTEAPPWHAVTGTWVNASTGPEPLGRNAAVVADIDLVMALSSAVPLDRTPLPVTGQVCVADRSDLGLGGTYVLDPAQSTWSGADYGGARLDLVAQRSDGASLTIAQAHMANRTPTQLSNAILTFRISPENRPVVFSFEDWRGDANAECAVPSTP